MDTDLTDLTAIRLTTAELVAGLRTMAVGPMPSPMGQMLTAAADRIEALERALVTARTAIEQVEWVFWHPGMAPKCPWCGGRKGGNKRDGHKPDCKRQQALTEIAGVTP